MQIQLDLQPPIVALNTLPQPQVCYALLTWSAQAPNEAWPINWAFVADASRSMRIPVIEQAQFLALQQQQKLQQVMVDGVPVWQLEHLPSELLQHARSPLDYVVRALHSSVERLAEQDRFALIACAEEAVLLNPSTAGDERTALVHSINRLPSLNMGEETDLALAIGRALAEVQAGRYTLDVPAVERIVLLTDGFTKRPEACLSLAQQAANAGISISTIGLGSEFQADLLTALADRTGGRAIMIPQAEQIPQVIAHELDLARQVAVRSVSLDLRVQAGVQLRRITRIRPALATLYEAGIDRHEISLALGDLGAKSQTILIEMLAEPQAQGRKPLLELAFRSAGKPQVQQTLFASFQSKLPEYPKVLLDAAERAAAMRLEQRAQAMARQDQLAEAARLMSAAASRFAALGEQLLAQKANEQAALFTQGMSGDQLASKQLSYATRRLAANETAR
jgi:Ca-activated chloride channel family protein